MCWQLTVMWVVGLGATPPAAPAAAVTAGSARWCRAGRAWLQARLVPARTRASSSCCGRRGTTGSRLQQQAGPCQAQTFPLLGCPAPYTAVCLSAVVSARRTRAAAPLAAAPWVGRGAAADAWTTLVLLLAVARLLLACRSSYCPVAMSECTAGNGSRQHASTRVCLCVWMWDASGCWLVDPAGPACGVAKQLTRPDCLLCHAVSPCCCRFCSGCIQTWLKEHTSCPVCRWTFPECDTRLINK